jgi:hypothetical protein
MPAIVLRISFKRVLRSKWTHKELIAYISKKFQALDQELFLVDFLKLLYYGEAETAMDTHEAQNWRDRLLESFTFGTSGETKIGILDSLYPNCFEFWITSSNTSKCLEGRQWIMKNLPSIRNRTIRKIQNDYLYVEGGTEIARERIFRTYLLKSGLNAGLFVNFLILLLRSIYDFYNAKNLDYGLPLLVFMIWLIALIFTYMYNRGKVLYIVKEE